MSLVEGLVLYCENLIVVKGKTHVSDSASSRGLEYTKCPRRLTWKEEERGGPGNLGRITQGKHMPQFSF